MKQRFSDIPKARIFSNIVFKIHNLQNTGGRTRTGDFIKFTKGCHVIYQALTKFFWWVDLKMVHYMTRAQIFWLIRSIGLPVNEMDKFNFLTKNQCFVLNVWVKQIAWKCVKTIIEFGTRNLVPRKTEALKDILLLNIFPLKFY